MFNVDRVLLWKDAKVLGMDGGGGRPTAGACFMPLTCALKNGSSGAFEFMWICVDLTTTKNFTLRTFEAVPA